MIRGETNPDEIKRRVKALGDKSNLLKISATGTRLAREVQLGERVWGAGVSFEIKLQWNELAIAAVKSNLARSLTLKKVTEELFVIGPQTGLMPNLFRDFSAFAGPQPKNNAI